MRPHPGLRRLDIAALLSAVLLPPIGFVIAIFAIQRGKAVRGWASDLARIAVVVSLVATIAVLAIGSYVGITEAEKARVLAEARAEQRAHARIEAASEPFCGTLEAYPTIFAEADPDYGWPPLDAPGGYLAAIAEYSAAWTAIAEVAPEGIAGETTAISERVAEIVGIATALGAENRAGNLLDLHQSDDLATVESWWVEYCPQQ